MKEKIVKIINTSWLIGLIGIAAGLGWLTTALHTGKDPFSGFLVAFLSALYTAYSGYWSYKQGQDGIK